MIDLERLYVSEDDGSVIARCVSCEETGTLPGVTVPEVKRYFTENVPAQVCFPNAHPETREFLITGRCSPSCAS